MSGENSPICGHMEGESLGIQKRQPGLCAWQLEGSLEKSRMFAELCRVESCETEGGGSISQTRVMSSMTKPKKVFLQSLVKFLKRVS